MMAFSCPHLKSCSGCSPLAISIEDQQALKVDNFKSHAQKLLTPLTLVKLHSLGDGFIRTRFELSWQEDRWGFWSQDENKILEINVCHQIDPRLNDFFQKFKKIKWPMKKASVRLRISPAGRFGIWLDLANEDVRDLFETQVELLQALELGDVEVGQRRKQLVYEDERLRLKDPVYAPWISTFVGGQEIPLSSLVGGFSQTGPAATKKICEILENLLSESKSILEFGSGFGTLTLPAAGQNQRQVIALEVDERSTEALRLTLEQNKMKTVEVIRGDFQKKSFSSEAIFDTYLVNPPRSGVQNLLLNIPPEVKTLVYMSCFEESFFKDSENLTAQGFWLNEAHLIDQFPQTPHTEWISLWKR